MTQTHRRRTLVMGVVNVTDDSFSDGGRYLDCAAAVEHGLRLAADGAAIIDVGGESTRPGAVRPEAVTVNVASARFVPNCAAPWTRRWQPGWMPAT